MSFELFIARKHLMHRRKAGFISLISLISVAGVSVGVMALIVVLGVMSGFDRELKAKIVNVQPHLRIEKIGGVDSPFELINKLADMRLPDVQTISPYIEGQAILKSEVNAMGVIVRGLHAPTEDLSIYKEKIVAGELNFDDMVRHTKKKWLLFFKRDKETSYGSLFLGENLAAQLRVRVGDTVTMISPFQVETKKNVLSAQTAEARPFIVRGIFRMGMNDFDSAMAVISLHQAQQVYHLNNRATGIGIRFMNVDSAQQWKMFLSSQLGHLYFVRSWYDMNENFFQALKVEKSVMTILLALIILVAAFNIVSTLIMVVMEKTGDIGILRAIGATRASIGRIFVIEGFSVGFLGVLIGSVLGLSIAFNLNSVSDFIRNTTGLEVFPSDIYFFDRIPVEVNAGDVGLIISFAVIASILAGFYPAHRASKLEPVEALRYG